MAAIDSWPIVEKVYADNFPDATFYRSKCENVSPERVRTDSGKIDLIVASPECTSHTCAKGSAQRSEESKQTAFQVYRFAKALKPRWIVVENVVQMRAWPKYTRWLRRLANLGYHHREQVLDSADFGVPQSRKRLFVIFDKKKVPPEVVPPARKMTLTAANVILQNGYRFVPLKTERRAQRTLQSAERAITTIGPNRKFLIVYYGSDGGGGWQPLDVPLRTITTLDRFALVKPTKQGHQMRMLQVPELRKAMGFAASFKLEHGTRREQIKMLGNGVCPPVMRAILSALTQNGKRSS